ncbi:hypothetical protein [Lactobacillus helveticus]|uniref:Uncharacterized protein n=1 Tax=Lactobacillus helveticus TaxID=1587 RepID=A0A8H9F9J1_LACHE|nr:hypothetical protein [Lactobacillus helveticus]KRO10596.1 hypothetical protein IV62_GL001702 [Lactobacillus helveticus]MBW8062158.1 hypothetical protein [Lactobacillus helveticus]GFP00087.1 hypothetical protein LHEH8_18420 [Lactobacillus helveticus]GFP00888.1 hypothetical protein LHEW6_07210 [Lactobacillus helveticus]GFP03820.1 hypothetical protein LHEY10_17490 [Lactobacillus helveticus]
MKIKRILAFLAGMLIAISAVWITNQPEQVSASVFQKTTVPKKFRGTWYRYWGNGKVKSFKITRTEINLDGCADSKGGVYKYTKRAFNAKSGSSHLLIKTKGNRMWICAPHGQTSAAYVTNNRQKLYVFVTTWPNTYSKSKSAAQRNYKADSSMSRRDKLSKLVWGN